jgi:hypothetical protein
VIVVEAIYRVAAAVGFGEDERLEGVVVSAFKSR